MRISICAVLLLMAGCSGSDQPMTAGVPMNDLDACVFSTPVEIAIRLTDTGVSQRIDALQSLMRRLSQPPEFSVDLESGLLYVQLFRGGTYYRAYYNIVFPSTALDEPGGYRVRLLNSVVSSSRQPGRGAGTVAARDAAVIALLDRLAAISISDPDLATRVQISTP